MKRVNFFLSREILEFLKSISAKRGDFSWHVRRALEVYVVIYRVIGSMSDGEISSILNGLKAIGANYDERDTK